jgi:hypothetical protein
MPVAQVCIRLVAGPNMVIMFDNSLPDFLLMIGGIGCFVSSAITLLVSKSILHPLIASHRLYESQLFFPRSITKETGYMHHSPKAHVSDQASATSTYQHTHPEFDPEHQPQYQFDPHPRPDPHLHYLRDHYHRDSKDSASFHIPMVDRPLHSQTGRTSLSTFRFPVAIPLDPEAAAEYGGPEDARQLESLPPEATVWDTQGGHGTSTTYLNPHPQSRLRRTTTSGHVTPVQRTVEAGAPSTRLHPYVSPFPWWG